MNDKQILAWCQKHHWTEPRKLDVGIWVAFPPNGYMETPVPVLASYPKGWRRFISLSAVFGALLLSICGIAVGLVAICIAPLFLWGMRGSRNRE